MSTISQHAFSSGEIGPELQARVDTSKYQSALKTCRNFMVLRHGGASVRAGTIFVSPTRVPTDKVKLFPFVQSAAIQFVLEFGAGYIRFYKNGAPIMASGLATWNSATAYTPGNLVTYQGANFYCNANGINQTPNPAASTFYWTIMKNGYLEVPTPYQSYDLSTIKVQQQLNKLVIVHNLYPPAELTRLNDVFNQSWTYLPIAFQPNLNPPVTVYYSAYGGTTPAPPASQNTTATPIAPVPPSGSPPVSNQTQFVYAFTSVDASGDESLPAYGYCTATQNSTYGVTSATNPINITITPVVGAQYFNVYRQFLAGSNNFGLLGSVTASGTLGVVFQDINSTANIQSQPPVSNTPFNGFGNYPGVVSLIQQRLVFASTLNQPETVWLSRTSSYHNFDVSTISEDSDAITFKMSGKQLNTVTNILELGSLVLFTPTSEMSVNGDQSGILKPSSISLKTEGLAGSAVLTPLIVSGSIIFLQARGTAVRDLAFQFQAQGYRGNELSIYAPHLVENYQIVDWAYQQIPQSIVWMVRDDGTLLGLTYVKEQDMLAWHRHDFSGTLFNASVENVCTISEGGQDFVYLAIRRYINGVNALYIERMDTRSVPDLKRTLVSSPIAPYPFTAEASYIGSDCSLGFDGRKQQDGVTPWPAMTISGGTLWDNTELLTLTAQVGYFVNTFVGNQFVLTQSQGEIVRFTITNYVSLFVVQGYVDRLVPLTLQNLPTTGISRAVSKVSGLTQLEGENVSILADGFVVASPRDSNYPVYTVVNGTINLDRCYTVIRVGLPITADLQTLNIDTAQGESIVDKKKIGTEITVTLSKSRGVFVGQQRPAPTADHLDQLTELKSRQYENYDQPVTMTTGIENVTIAPSFNQTGSIFLRQVDPLPLTVLSISVDGEYPFRNGGQ